MWYQRIVELEEPRVSTLNVTGRKMLAPLMSERETQDLRQDVESLEDKIHQFHRVHIISAQGAQTLKFNSDSKMPSFQSWTFTRLNVEMAGGKKTWSRALRSIAPIWQADLARQLQEQREKGIAVLTQYNGLSLFQSAQIDRLCEDLNKAEKDQRLEWNIASAKKKERHIGSDLKETVSMQVIMKRILKPAITQSSSKEKSKDPNANVIYVDGRAYLDPRSLPAQRQPSSYGLPQQQPYQTNGGHLSGHQHSQGPVEIIHEQPQDGHQGYPSSLKKTKLGAGVGSSLEKQLKLILKLAVAQPQ